jgi:cell division protein FtsW (lipid II flippase)
MFSFLKGRLVFTRFVLLSAALALLTIGIATIYAIGNPAESNPASRSADLQTLWKKQMVFAVIGAVFFIAVNLVNYRRLGGVVAYWIYAVILVLLTVLLLDKVVDITFVPVINNARRWLRIGTGSASLQVQPSEFCKLAYILALAWYLRYRTNYRSFSALVGPFALTLLPMTLILAEPNLGTTLLMMPILFIMLFVAGAKAKHLLLIILLAFLVSPFMWHKLKPYQRTRVSSVLLQSDWARQKVDQHPAVGKILTGSAFGARQLIDDWGYHLVRSKFAIASGGFTGYGYRQGPFIKYNFLPERHNDFVFAVIAHQWGFLGCLGLLGLYVIIITCGLEIAEHNTDPFGRLIAVGIVTMFTAEVVVNIGMTLGLMPITGLTLPLVSYGGSSLVVSMTAIGLLNNVGRCRPFSVATRTVE